MQTFKLEIIIDNIYLEELLNLLEYQEVSGYTALDISRSKGIKHGESLREGLLPTTRKTLLMILITELQYKRVYTSIEKFIRNRDGLIFSAKIEALSKAI